MDTVTAAKRLVRAINRAADEHGRPNTFGFRERRAKVGDKPTTTRARASPPPLVRFGVRGGGAAEGD